MSHNTTCILCGNAEIEEIPDNRDVSHWNCPNCHEVLITRTAMASINQYESQYWLLSAYFRRQSKLGLPIEILDSVNAVDIINNIKKPKNIHEKKSHIIEYYGDNADLLGTYVRYDPFTFLDVIIEKSELEYLLHHFYQRGILEMNYDPLNSRGNYEFGEIRLSTEGWELYHDLKMKPVISNQVFIAMWFNDETNNLRETLKSAIVAAGYDPMIVDERHFTGNIMDYVVGQIKQSKFLIADFTVQPEETSSREAHTVDESPGTRIRNGSRGGVYYEAGFARGLGLEVINTCKNNNISKNRIHFDTVQDNTLFWKVEDVEHCSIRRKEERIENASPENFAEIIYDRILSIFGQGENITNA